MTTLDDESVPALVAEDTVDPDHSSHSNRDTIHEYRRDKGKIQLFLNSTRGKINLLCPKNTLSQNST